MKRSSSSSIAAFFLVAICGAIFLYNWIAISKKTFSGYASIYSDDVETASGQSFDKDALSAAHRTLPFGTRVKVIRGDRSVVVTINDRGPFVEGRVLDLTPRAARALGFTGVERVTAEIQ